MNLGNGAGQVAARGRVRAAGDRDEPAVESERAHLTNLSTAPAANFAPAEAAAFDDRVLGKRIVGANPANYVDFLADGRFRETEGADTYEGGYTYGRTGTHAATVVFRYDDGETCTYELTFASRTAGSLSFTCDEEAAGESELASGGVERWGDENRTEPARRSIRCRPVRGSSTGSAATWASGTVGGEPDIQFGEGGLLGEGQLPVYVRECRGLPGPGPRGHGGADRPDAARRIGRRSSRGAGSRRRVPVGQRHRGAAGGILHADGNGAQPRQRARGRDHLALLPVLECDDLHGRHGGPARSRRTPWTHRRPASGPRT